MVDDLSVAKPDYLDQERQPVVANMSAQQGVQQNINPQDPAKMEINAVPDLTSQCDGPSAYLNAPGNTSILGECLTQTLKTVEEFTPQSQEQTQTANLENNKVEPVIIPHSPGLT